MVFFIFSIVAMLKKPPSKTASSSKSSTSSLAQKPVSSEDNLPEKTKFLLSSRLEKTELALLNAQRSISAYEKITDLLARTETPFLSLEEAESWRKDLNARLKYLNKTKPL